MLSKTHEYKHAILEGVLSVMKWRGQEEKRKKKTGNCHGLAVDIISLFFF